MKMVRTLTITAGLVLVLTALTITATPAAQSSGSLESGQGPKNRGASKPVAGNGNASDTEAAMEEEEKELDKELDEEVSKRKKESALVTKKPKETAKNGTYFTLGKSLCNDALQQDLSRPGSLTLCACGVHEVMINGTCVHYSHDVVIDAEFQYVHWQETPVSNFRVRVEDLECDADTNQMLTFERGTFFLRNRGDVVLTSAAGDLAGLRVGDYCINHYLDQDGSLSWKMKACIPHPSVPRCCPPGQVFRNGTCRTGPSPNHLVPLIHANPLGTGEYLWPVIGNHINTIKCVSQKLRTVALDINHSFLVALPNGLAYLWHDPSVRIKYFFCPTFCIDGVQSVDGTIEYLANFCYTPEAERVRRTCQTDTCIRKCCRRGEVMSFDHFRCVKTEGAKFSPPVRGNLSDYEVITGQPECSLQIREEAVDFIDEEGKLHYRGRSLEADRYCIDTFTNRGKKRTEALVCERIRDPMWWNIRPILLPACYVISLIFLGITVGFFMLAPVLLKQGGWHMLSYVLSLMLAYASTFSVTAYLPEGTSCVALAILMQFGFLATFFWLCIMCFDIERKIRTLRQFRAYIPFHPAVYFAAGFGIPLLICIVTIIVMTTVPYGTPGIIRPSIGVSRCWFDDDMEILMYFYGPIAILFICNIAFIASTAWNYHKIEKVTLGMMMKSKTEENKKCPPPLEYERQKQTRRNLAEFKNKFLLLSLMCFCWITEILSWKIQPLEIWAFTDVLNSLQGFFIFIIFLSYRKNRKTLKRLHPRLCSCFQPFVNVFRKIKRFLLPKSSSASNSGDAAGRSREPSISSEYSDLSDNYKPQEPAAPES